VGGFGSGRRSSTEKVEEHRVLDVSAMNKAGCLSGPRSGSWQWSRDDEVVASIRFRYDEGRLHLDYRFRSGNGDWQPVNEVVRIDWRSCRFGGRRPYFVCPGIRNGVVCSRPVTKLYGASTWFLCRHCYGLRYASQSEDVYDRAQRKANRLRRSLDRTSRGMGDIPERPKGMWRRTYDRRIDAIIALDDFTDQKLALFAARLLKLGGA
jgi:hypothetical protein